MEKVSFEGATKLNKKARNKPQIKRNISIN